MSALQVMLILMDIMLGYICLQTSRSAVFHDD